MCQHGNCIRSPGTVYTDPSWLGPIRHGTARGIGIGCRCVRCGHTGPLQSSVSSLQLPCGGFQVWSGGGRAGTHGCWPTITRVYHQPAALQLHISYMCTLGVFPMHVQHAHGRRHNGSSSSTLRVCSSQTRTMHSPEPAAAALALALGHTTRVGSASPAEGVDREAAAAIPIVYGTADVALRHRAQLAPGEGPSRSREEWGSGGGGGGGSDLVG